MSDTQNKLQLATLSFFIFTTSAAIAYAEPGNRSGHPGGPHGGHTPEAIKACSDLTEGDACSFAGRRGEDVEGTCIVPPRGDEALVCAPEGGPPQGVHRPMHPPKPENVE